MSEPWTPGPWHWRKDSVTPDGGELAAADGTIVIGPSQERTDRIAIHPRDVNLIALAPEMAELLQECGDSLENEDEWEGSLRERVYTLLAKARGTDG